MKNITVSVDEETHRQARIRAAEMGTSVSALVRGYLTSLCSDPETDPKRNPTSEAERLEQRRKRIQAAIDDIRASGGGLLMSEIQSRDELYDEAWRERNAIR